MPLYMAKFLALGKVCFSMLWLRVLLFYCGLFASNAKTTPTTLLPEDRINQGQNVDLTDFPFMVNIWQEGKFICGGTLVTSRCVLTSSRCILSARREQTRIFGHLKSANQQAFESKVALVVVPTESSVYSDYSNTSTPPSYNQTNSNGPDIALLVLQEQFNLDAVSTIELDTVEVEQGDPVIVAGWGGTAWLPNGPTDALRVVNSTVVDDFHCKLFWNTETDKSNDVFCIDEEGGKRPCNNDTGGPAIRRGKQVGIVSRVNRCDHRPAVGLYTRLSSRTVRQFIKQNFEKHC